MADMSAIQANLQKFASMLMQMMSQQKYIKDSSASWLERSLKQYGAQEAMHGREGIARTKNQILLEVLKSAGKGAEGLDNPELAMLSRASAASGEDYIPGLNFPQPTVTREEAVAPTRDAIQDIVRQFHPENIDLQEALTNIMMTKGSDESLTQMKEYTKITEADKERTLKSKGQALEEKGLGIRAGELKYKEAGMEKVDKIITKIEKARENRSDLMDKISSQTMDNFFASTSKSQKNVIKHVLSLNSDIRRYKKEAKGYKDPDLRYAEAAELAKKGGATKKFFMKILMGAELEPDEVIARDRLKGYLDKEGLLLPILMEYF